MGTQGRPDATTSPRGDFPSADSLISQFDPLIESVVSWPKWRFDFHSRQDVAQAIRIGLPAAVEKFQHESSLEYFVKQICVRRCIDEVRRQVRKRNVFVSLFEPAPDDPRNPLDAPADETFDPVYQVTLRERATALRGLLEKLDQTCRDAIRRFYLDDLSYKEIGEALGIAVNTVGSRLSKCLGKLKEIGAAAAELKEDF